MTTSKSNESPVFNTRTLRLIIGALAFAFPSTVIALTGGKITTSISASYHEVETRDVFVGFLFIIGALLIAYKGHLQGRPRRKSENLRDWILAFKWARVYQEEIISTIGGLAAIFTALHPTACDGCPMNPQARIHTAGAFILFSAVVYFSLVAFMRSVNKKLVRANPRFRKLAYSIRSIRSLRDVRSGRDLRYLLFPTISTFFSIASQISTDYDEDNSSEIAKALPPEVKDKPNKLMFMWIAYGKKVSRGIVYLVCGSLITATLAVFLLLVLTTPEMVAHSIITFVIETISLVLFGIAWMTASQLEYLKQILSWLPERSRKTATEPLADAA